MKNLSVIVRWVCLAAGLLCLCTAVWSCSSQPDYVTLRSLLHCSSWKAAGLKHIIEVCVFVGGVFLCVLGMKPVSDAPNE